jgi:2-octaprenyl-6-methoxyphenol hydroxylase
MSVELHPIPPVSASAQPQPAQSAQNTAQPSLETAPGLECDVAIVGGGIVGLTLACALKSSGLQVALIEAKAESAAVTRGQAYHINLMSSLIFRQLGVWSAMRPHVNPIQQIRLSDGDYPGVVQFGQKEFEALKPLLPLEQVQADPALGFVAEHRVVMEALQASLDQCTTLTRLCPVEVVQTLTRADGVDLLLRQGETLRSLRSRLVVAADGARSPLRQQAHIGTSGWRYWQSCVVAFIQPEKPHGNIAYERFWPSGPFAILPLPNNLCRIVWTAPKAEAEAILALDDQAFLAQLQQRYGDQMGQLSLAGQRYLFPVQLMQSRRYTQARLALIGDAAHCCHPVGGQGVNLGIRDAAALAQVMDQAQRQGRDIGDRAVLARYGRWRSWENLVILGFTDVLNRVFSNSFLPLVWVRRLGLWLLQRIVHLKLLALKLMVGLLGQFPYR